MVAILPEVISRYFSSAERCDLPVLITCFADDATLVDGGRTYHGRQEIHGWRNAAGPAYEYVVEVLNWERTADGAYVVDANVAGTVTGDPSGCTFHFTLHDDLIGALRIAPL